jgi:hypothetical protein
LQEDHDQQQQDQDLHRRRSTSAVLDRLKDRPTSAARAADGRPYDLAKRAEIACAADIAVLCLPDAAPSWSPPSAMPHRRDRRQHRPSRRRRLDLASRMARTIARSCST